MSETKYRIWSFEHNAWWRPNWCDYTPHIELAGIYSKEIAEVICMDANAHGKINEEMREVTDAT